MISRKVNFLKRSRSSSSSFGNLCRALFQGKRQSLPDDALENQMTKRCHHVVQLSRQVLSGHRSEKPMRQVSMPCYLQFDNYSKQKEKTNLKDEGEENHWGGPEAFKLILFLKDDFDAQVKKHDSIMVFFSATWCPHCLKLRKPYGTAALMSKEANLPMVFATYDVNYNPDFAQGKGVVGVPLIKYYKGGKFVVNYRGKRTSQELFEFAKNPPTAKTQSEIEY